MDRQSYRLTLRLTDWPSQVNEDFKVAHTTDKNCGLETESAEWADLVKIYKYIFVNLQSVAKVDLQKGFC